ncbi:hypothetical protein JCM18916_2885 [Cutibacterium acnes JCM 18916]|nr:hypothetical protein JCM18916_2885 [Cutibacterium acnes JCM 18916]
MTAPRHGEASDDSDAQEDTDHIASAVAALFFPSPSHPRRCRHGHNGGPHHDLCR